MSNEEGEVSLSASKREEREGGRTEASRSEREPELEGKRTCRARWKDSGKGAGSRDADMAGGVERVLEGGERQALIMLSRLVRGVVKDEPFLDSEEQTENRIVSWS